MIYMHETIFVVDKRSEDSLSEIRCMEGISAAVEGNNLLLKYSNKISEADNKLLQLPVKKTFLVDDQHQLFEKDSMTPVSVLKELEWLPLTALLKVESQPFAMPAILAEKHTVKIVPSNTVVKSNALLTELNIFKNYAETSSAIRLQTLKFAASEKNQVLIIGNPLPPIPGTEYWQAYDMLIPCGYNFEIPFMSKAINDKINEKKDSVILFDVHGNYQKIDKNFFVQATRSAIRSTNKK
ncbi:MAG TPA: hypothetical protein VKT28_00595 [Puia sp.]|nr:hypothetical protein [Puia sp.]